MVATGHVVQEVGERAGPATQLPVSGGLNTVERGEIGGGYREYGEGRLERGISRIWQ